MSTHSYTFDGIDNFRDFGNHASRLGGRVSHARLFRSGHYAAASVSDLTHLQKLNITLIVDLRRPTERKQDQTPQVPEQHARILAHDGDDLGESPHLAFLKTTDMSETSIHRYLVDYYQHAPFTSRFRDLFARYFAALATLEGAAWIHCAAGKDRTGILVALTLDLLGVGMDDIASDFLLTNEVMKVEERIETYGPVIEKMIGRPPTDAAIRAFLGVDLTCLCAMLAVVRERHGCVEGYVTQYLGLGMPTLHAIQSRLICGNSGQHR